jgi:hypothetical protein
MQNDLLLPLAGVRLNNNGFVNYQGNYGSYWSSSPRSTNSYDLSISSLNINPTNGDNRSYGLSVRCFKNMEVCDRVTDIPKAECKALVDFYYSTNGDGWTKGYAGRTGEAGKI